MKIKEAGFDFDFSFKSFTFKKPVTSSEYFSFLFSKLFIEMVLKKQLFGTLFKDMVWTCTVHNSFIDHRLVVVQSLSRVWLFESRELQHDKLPFP